MASTLATASRRAAARLPQHLLLLESGLSHHRAAPACACVRPSAGAAARRSHTGGSGGAVGNLLPDAASAQRHPPQPRGLRGGGQQPSAEYHTSQAAEFRTGSADSDSPSAPPQRRPGSIAFGECEIHALSDLFHQFATTDGGEDGGGDGEKYLSEDRVRLLLESIGERPSDATFRMLIDNVDSNRDGRVTLEEFLSAADLILGKSPARVVLVVGGPGSGKGALCERLAAECGAVHLSCGEMLREEVESGTPLGLEVRASWSGASSSARRPSRRS